MPERFTVFDVETPNAANDRMSAVGITLVEDRAVVGRFYSIVNPEERFDPFNIALTGITPAMAARSPTFPDLWETIRPYMEFGILCAHNAPFDMSVLSKCLVHYALPWRERTEYLCSCRFSRAVWPDLENHRLDTLARFLGVSLCHHRADSDSEVCARILVRCLEEYGGCGARVRVWDFASGRTVPPKRTSRKRTP